MSGSKIRNIAIVSLLLVNIVFLTVIVVDALEYAQAEREAIENVSAILRAGGITIDTEVIRSSETIATMRTARVVEAEATIARALLGETTITDQGGGIYLYENPARGVAEFYSGGDFEIRLIDGAVTSAGSAAGTVQSLLREMELETTQITAAVDAETSAEIVTAVVAYRGLSIFNCTIDFVFSGDSLIRVEGRYVAGIEPSNDGIVISQVNSALIRFMAAVRDESREEVVCTEIFAVESGFRHRVVGSFGEGVIDPVWLITTDNGRFLFDDLTGETWQMG